jgi:HK97 gp10 family phage protein
MNGVVEWDTDEVKTAVLQRLAANGEAAGKFVETEARRRLEAIDDPDWGRAYRTQIVSRLLMSAVEQRQNEVVVGVGVSVGSGGRHHGYYIELGSSTAPAQPFLRPAVANNARRIVDLFTG